MKKLTVFILPLAVVFMVLTACINNKSSVSGDTDRMAGGSLTDPVVQYIRIGSGFGPRNPTCTVISSVSELEQYSRNFNSGSFWDTGYTEAVSRYTTTYFSNNFLVIVFLEENSGSNRHKVESINNNGDIVIQQIIPEIGTTDMATWNIIIELNNSYKQEQFRVILR